MDISASRLSDRAVVCAAMLAAAVIGFAGINVHLPGGGDNAGYIGEAEAWLTLGRRANLFEVGTPTDTLKPPLFSILLAGVEFLFGRNVFAMKAMLVLFAAGSVWAAWWALRAGLKEDLAAGTHPLVRNAAIVSFWFALTPSLLSYSHDVLTDVPFTFFVLLALGFLFRAIRPNASFMYSVALVGVLSTATLLRFAGIIVAGACCGGFCIEAIANRKDSQWRRLAVQAVVLAVLTFVLFAYQQSSKRNYASLISHEKNTFAQQASVSDLGLKFSDDTLISRIVRVGSFYLCFMPAEIGGYAGLGPLPAVVLLAVLSLVFCVLGVWRLWRDGIRVVPTCWLLYHGVLLLVPWSEPRYYLPLFPLYLCLVWHGAAWILQSAVMSNAVTAPVALFIVGLCPAVSIFGTLLMFGVEPIEGATVVEWFSALVTMGILAAAVAKAPSAELRRRRASVALGGVFLLLVLCRGVSENVVREQRRGPVPNVPGWPELYNASLWLKQNASPEDGIASGRMSLVWYWSGRKGVNISSLADRKQAEAQLAKAKWAIVDGIGEDLWSQRVLSPLILDQQRNWAVSWSEGNTVILKRRSGN